MVTCAKFYNTVHVAKRPRRERQNSWKVAWSAGYLDNVVDGDVFSPEREFDDDGIFVTFLTEIGTRERGTGFDGGMAATFSASVTAVDGGRLIKTFLSPTVKVG